MAAKEAKAAEAAEVAKPKVVEAPEPAVKAASTVTKAKPKPGAPTAHTTAPTTAPAA
jgi:hypothetical protein